jgi:hypothetical protein
MSAKPGFVDHEAVVVAVLPSGMPCADRREQGKVWEMGWSAMVSADRVAL